MLKSTEFCKALIHTADKALAFSVMFDWRETLVA